MTRPDKPVTYVACHECERRAGEVERGLRPMNVLYFLQCVRQNGLNWTLFFVCELNDGGFPRVRSPKTDREEKKQDSSVSP
jgi:hypothetical protein